MKKAIFYTIRRGPYGRSHYIMAVTTERGRRYYGRNQHDEPTNAAARDCKGRFDTEAAARKCLQDVDRTFTAYARRLAALDRKQRELAQERDQKIAVLCVRKPTNGDPIEPVR